MRRETIAVGSKSLTYLIAGPHEPAARQRPASAVVFLHAFPLQSAMWEPNFASMPDGWRAIAPDLRWERGVGISDLAGDMVDLLDGLGISRAAVVGCSMGGYVLFEMLKSAPRYISAVGLVSTRPGADNEEGRSNRRKMIGQADRDGVEAIAAQMVPKLLSTTAQREKPEVVERVRSLILLNTADRVKAAVTAMMERSDSTPLLQKIDVPTLIVHGADDALIPPAEAEGMHRAIRHSHLELIPLCGHLPNLEQPERFDGVLRQFLNKL
jgi:pimeloyl-ACP methyl ester carboxylesterase